MTNIKYIKEKYNKNSEKYNYHVINHNFWYKYVEKPAVIKFIKDEVRGKTVLDLGCGSGPFIKTLKKLGAKKIKGIDLSSGLIGFARKNNPNVEFYVGDSRKTPFKNNEFDLISSSLMVHYVKDLSQLFKEVDRILKKDGLFVFTMHHPVFEVVERVKKNGKPTKKRIFKDYFHNNLYHWKLAGTINLISYHHTFENIFNSLANAGFIVEDLIETRAPKSSEKINKRIYDWTNQTPTFLAIKARKRG